MMQHKKVAVRLFAAAPLFVSLVSCAVQGQDAPAASATRRVVELPLVSGWYDGKEVDYVTTDVSDPAAALEMGANYVPRLANAIVPVEPGKPGAVERIYRITNFKQGGVLPSIPKPVGAANRNRNYSPFWQVYAVTWGAGVTPHLLQAEEDILDAEEKGQLSIRKTNIVVNCPVVFYADQGILPGAVIKTVPALEH